MTEKNKGGAPRKYSQSHLDIALDYLDNHHTKHDDLVPSVEGLAYALNVSKQTLLNWKDLPVSQEFLDTFNRIKQKQCKLLMSNGLANLYNPAITKLMLHNHGYNDKQDVDNTSSDGSMKPTVIQLVGKDES